MKIYDLAAICKDERDFARQRRDLWKRAAKKWHSIANSALTDWFDERDVFQQAAEERDHWLGECRRLVEMIMNGEPVYAELYEASERILRELGEDGEEAG